VEDVKRILMNVYLTLANTMAIVQIKLTDIYVTVFLV